ncbi:MAG: T9SS type A sorting domain-containing protein [Crocinitomicaceae bacterium]
MKATTLTLLFTLFLASVHGQCSPTISANTTSNLYMGDTLWFGNHHLCFNAYASYFSNNPDTIYMEPQSTLTILWSDQLVLYVAEGANVIKGGDSTNNFIIKELFYDTPSNLADTSNMIIQSSTYCSGLTFDYTQMDSMPDQGCIGTANVEKFQADRFNIYPNPSSGSFVIETAESGEMYLFDLAGNKVMNQILQNGQNTIDGQSLAVGVYLVRIRFTNKVFQSKLVIK